MHFSNVNRPHQSLGYVTPEQMYTGKAEEVLRARKQGQKAARQKRRKSNFGVA